MQDNTDNRGNPDLADPLSRDALTQKYKRFLEIFLKEKLPLELIDRRLTESELDFRPVSESKQDPYQRSSGMELRFFYLRSNLHVDKLSGEELRFLDGKESYDHEAREFIDATVERVVNPYDETRILLYGPENERYMCNSDEIALALRYDEFETALPDDAFAQNFLDKQNLLAKIIMVLEIVALTELHHGVRVMQYNEATVLFPGTEE